MVGIDLAKPYLAFVKRFRAYNDLVLCDIRKPPFRKKALDIVLAMEVLEHLPKKDGIAFIGEVKKVAKERIVLTTPNGYYAQAALSGIETERHLSGWTVSELKKFGFNVKGFGFRFFRSTKISYIYHLLGNLFTPVSYLIPEFAGFLVAYLDVKG